MRILVLALCAGVCATASAQTATQASRGELLYATHCIACHAREIHWRQNKLATDWASLQAQVRRWAGNAGLGWSEQEIVDVAAHLNATHYRFAAPSVTWRRGGSGASFGRG